MNKADNLSEKSCNSLVFEDEAKVLTFACITTDNVKDAIPVTFRVYCT